MPCASRCSIPAVWLTICWIWPGLAIRGLALRHEWQSLPELMGSARNDAGGIAAGAQDRLSYPGRFSPHLCRWPHAGAGAGQSAGKWLQVCRSRGHLYLWRRRLVVMSWRSGWRMTGPVCRWAKSRRSFEKFSRGDKESVIPCGAGSAICRAIIEAHGGRIRAEKSRRGARFTFTLPYKAPPPLEDIVEDV